MVTTTVCKGKNKIARLPFQFSWLCGWFIGLVNSLLTILMVVIALASISGCSVVQSVTSDGGKLWDKLKLPPLLKTCVFGNGDLMLAADAYKELKTIFQIRDGINPVVEGSFQVGFCPYLFFFESNINEAKSPGHEDIYRKYCGENKTINEC